MIEKKYRIIDKKELKTIVPYSYQHILRLEKSGKFPLRVKIGESRVGWVEEEIMDWISLKISERDNH
jgi:prophage regulatory protein